MFRYRIRVDVQRVDTEEPDGLRQLNVDEDDNTLERYRRVDLITREAPLTKGDIGTYIPVVPGTKAKES